MTTVSVPCPDCGDNTYEIEVEVSGRYLPATMVDPEDWPEVVATPITGDDRICCGCGYRLDDADVQQACERAEQRAALAVVRAPRRSVFTRGR